MVASSGYDEATGQGHTYAHRAATPISSTTLIASKIVVARADVLPIRHTPHRYAITASAVSSAYDARTGRPCRQLTGDGALICTSWPASARAAARWAASIRVTLPIAAMQ